MLLSLRARLDEANRLYPDVWEGFLRGIGPLEVSRLTSLGVMVSGGGDSVALLHLLWLWGRRPLEVFCVDHGLSPLSAGWTQTVEALCAGLEVGFTALRWVGDKPASGIQAAARQARHRLINEAARAKNIQILCLGHNADDGYEAVWMRGAGSSVGSPKHWGPSPLWPEGRDLFYLRPVLGVGRVRLRAWLRAAGIGYIDDPANENPAYLRARARTELARREQAQPQTVAGPSAPASGLVFPAHDPLSASLRIGRETLLAMDMDRARHWLACALVCAGGGDKLPRQDSVRAIYEAIRFGEGLNHSLCGARIWQLGEQVIIGRNSGEFARIDMPAVLLRPGETLVWDGRFEMTGGSAEGEILPLKGHMRHLTAQDMQRIKALPAALRGGLPVWRGRDGILHLRPSGGQVKSLVFRRFCAHAGLWRTEAEIKT